MKRIAFFVIYSNNKIISAYKLKLIEELLRVCNDIIIIVNGEVENIKQLYTYTKYVFQRENVGYDAGAYKEVFLYCQSIDLFNDYDEIVFCNDTFYGPFLPFEDIFNYMMTHECDFWGLNLSDSGVYTFIQSYFLVFKKRIIISEVLTSYFMQLADSKIKDFRNVLIYFEIGIYNYLIKNGFKAGAFNKQKYHILNSPDGSVCFDKLPILKKKAFSSRFFDNNKILNCLKYIKNNYDFDIDLILEDVMGSFGILITEDEIEKRNINIRSVEVDCVSNKIENLLDFIGYWGSIYVYGIGKMSESIVKTIGTDKIDGFIVSDGQKSKDFFMDRPVSELSEFKSISNIPIFVALNKENSMQVKSIIGETGNILYIY